MIKDTNPDHYKVDGADFIEYMHDPKISGFGNWMFANGYNTATLAAWPQWISVKERLPEKRGFYLVANPVPHGMKTFVYIAIYATDLQELDRYNFEGEHRSGWCVYSGDAGHIEHKGVTHWMPLPEPPRKEDQND